MTPLQQERVVAEAWSWLHTPYHSGARLKTVGVDCAQILCAVYSDAEVVPLVDPGYYAPDWHLHRSEEVYITWMDRYGTRVQVPEIGDVALYRFGRCYSHAAILVAPDTWVHAYLGRGVIVSKSNDEPLAGRPVMYWTIK